MRRWARWVGWLLTVAGILGVAAHLVGPVSNLATRVAAFTPVLILIGALGLVVLLVARWWLSAACAALVTLLGILTQAPLYHGASEQVSSADYTVVQANFYLGLADPGALVARVRADAATILTVVELTPAAVGRLDAAGLRRELPYAYVVPRAEGEGAGIYSRYPLRDTELLPGFELSNIRAEVDLPRIGTRHVYALHPVAPYPKPSWLWSGELRRLAEILSADSTPLVIGADMNSTYDHRRFRALLAGSDWAGSPHLTDAAEHVGAGIVATYPAGRFHPPFLALDRVLTRGGDMPTSFRSFGLPGSDHRGVVATVRPGRTR